MQFKNLPSNHNAHLPCFVCFIINQQLTCMVEVERPGSACVGEMDLIRANSDVPEGSVTCRSGIFLVFLTNAAGAHSLEVSAAEERWAPQFFPS